MPVKIPTQTARLSGTPAARLAQPDSGISVAREVGTAARAFNVLSVAAEARDEAFATEKYNKWNEAMTAKNQQLLLTRGSDATGLSEKINEESDAIIEGFEFDNATQMKSFNNMIKAQMSAYRSGLNKYEVAESVKSLARQKTVVMNNSVNTAVSAIASDDLEGVKASAVQYFEAYRSVNKGMDENVLVAGATEGFSQSLGKQLNNMATYNPTSTAVNALKLKNEGYLTDIDYQNAITVARNGYIKALGSTSFEDILNDPKNNFLTPFEVTGGPHAPKPGEGVFTNISLTYDEKVRRINEDVRKGVKVNDPIYGNITKELNTELSDFSEKYLDEDRSARKDLLKSLEAEYLNLGAAASGLSEGRDKDSLLAKQSVIASKMRQDGEFDKAKELEDLTFKNKETPTGIYNGYAQDIRSGVVTDVSELSGFVRKGGNSKDYDRLVKMLEGEFSAKQKRDTGLFNDMAKSTKMYEGFKLDTAAGLRDANNYLENASRVFSDLMSKANAKHSGDVPQQEVDRIISEALFTQTGEVSVLMPEITEVQDDVMEVRNEVLNITWPGSWFPTKAEKVDAINKTRTARDNLVNRGIDPTKENILKEAKRLYNAAVGVFDKDKEF